MSVDRSPAGVAMRHPIDSPSADEERDVVAYANGRIGNKPQLMVTFRQVNGASNTFAYSHLYSVTTDVDGAGFVAEFSQHKVAVQGRNLAGLYRYFCDHKVQLVLAMGESQAMAADETDSVVTAISIVPLTLQP